MRLTEAKAIDRGRQGACAHLWGPAGVTGKVLKDDGADSLLVELSLTYCAGWQWLIPREAVSDDVPSSPPCCFVSPRSTGEEDS